MRTASRAARRLGTFGQRRRKLVDPLGMSETTAPRRRVQQIIRYNNVTKNESFAIWVACSCSIYRHFAYLSSLNGSANVHVTHAVWYCLVWCRRKPIIIALYNQVSCQASYTCRNFCHGVTDFFLTYRPNLHIRPVKVSYILCKWWFSQFYYSNCSIVWCGGRDAAIKRWLIWFPALRFTVMHRLWANCSHSICLCLSLITKTQLSRRRPGPRTNFEQERARTNDQGPTIYLYPAFITKQYNFINLILANGQLSLSRCTETISCQLRK